MPKGSSFDNALLQLIFNNTAAAPATSIGSGLQAAVTAGSLYVSLHTADPTASGNQATSEIAYTGYARQAVARSAGGWTVTSATVSPTSQIAFGSMTAGAGGTVTHWSVGTASSGAGAILYTGTVSPNISVTVGVAPLLTVSSTITEA